MFRSKRRILEEKVAELEKEIREERAAHESDNKELEELKSRIELEERTIEEIRNALQKRLSEIEEKSRQYEKEEKIKREILQKEIEEKRKAAKQEIERYQAEQTDMLKKRIQDFGSQYHLYLSKIYQASEMLNNTALQIGNTFLENDTNISELFRVQTKDSLGNLTLGKEHPNPESEGPKVNVVPFLLWEDAPAEKKSQDM
ncbi:MAG: hypothetical protein HFH15_06055 [Ruminococcus sp.]|jgi:small-conductance mechanosensitive channel|nr:hypothetical protein [Ruminococcus sp.]